MLRANLSRHIELFIAPPPSLAGLLRIALFTIGFVFVVGCHDPHTIDVDLSSQQPRFTIHHVTWDLPARQPRVKEVVIGDRRDVFWHIRAIEASGTSAKPFAFVYGEVPEGFQQVAPAEQARAKWLESGVTYFIGAEGTHGYYRAAFAMPVGPLGPERRQGFPDRASGSPVIREGDRLVPPGELN